MDVQNLSIIIGTNACNAKCPYCVSRMTPNAEFNKKTDELNFNKACTYARDCKVSTVILTGKGEPTLYPTEISACLKKISKYGFPFIELQTNGTLLKNTHLKDWRKLGLNTISLSIIHYKDDKNEEIFKTTGKQELTKTINKLHNLGYTVRLSCTLIKEYIDTIERVKELINYAKENKIEQLTLRKLSTPENTTNNKVKEWTIKNALSKKENNKIKKYLDKNGTKLLQLDYGAIIYDVSGQNVCLTNALTIKPNGNIRQLIYYPNGRLRYDWQYMGATLL